MSIADHRKTAVTGVRCAVLTISDTRAPETDVSGRTIVELLEADGHVVAKRQILRDDPKDVHAAVLGQVGDDRGHQIVAGPADPELHPL